MKNAKVRARHSAETVARLSTPDLQPAQPLVRAMGSPSITDFAARRMAQSNIDHIRFLQTTVGNRAVQRFLDERSSSSSVCVAPAQSAPSISMSAETSEAQPEEERHQIPAVVEEFLQAKPASQRDTEVTPANSAGDLESQLSSGKGGGSGLPDETRQFMEARFGVDFKGVSVHTDAQSVRMNKQLGAQAFAYGSDLYFGDGKYDPSSDSGRWLLAHELTHVVQQTGGVQTKLDIGSPDDPLEREADRVASQVMGMSSPAESEHSESGDQSGYPPVYLEFLRSEPSSSVAPGVPASIHAKCEECEAADKEALISARAETASVPALPAMTLRGANSVQRGFFSGSCVAEHWNLAAALTATFAAAGGGIALLVAPEPTTITKWAAGGAILGVISGIAWTINAIVALKACLEVDPDANRREIEDLQRRLRQLEDAQRRIQEFQNRGTPRQDEDAESEEDTGVSDEIFTP